MTYVWLWLTRARARALSAYDDRLEAAYWRAIRRNGVTAIEWTP